MEYTAHPGSDGKEYVLSGRFTFTDQRKVAELKSELSDAAGWTRCVFDLKDVEFIDSSGLGGLIALREEAAGRGIEIVLRKPQEKVLKVLEACDFGSLFAIEA